MNYFVYICGNARERYHLSRNLQGSTGTNLLFTTLAEGARSLRGLRVVGYIVTPYAHHEAKKSSTLGVNLLDMVDVLERNIATAVPSHRYLPSYA